MPVLNLLPKLRLSKLRLSKLRKARMACKDAYEAACERNDTRAKHETWVALKAATKALMEAER